MGKSKKEIKGKNPYKSTGNSYFDSKIREVPKGLELKKNGWNRK